MAEAQKVKLGHLLFQSAWQSMLGHDTGTQVSFHVFIGEYECWIESTWIDLCSCLLCSHSCFCTRKVKKIYDWMFEMVVEWIVLPVLSDTHYSVVIFTSTHPSVIGRVNWDFWFGSLVLAKYELTSQLRAEAATANSTWLLWPAIFCILCDVHFWWISTWLVCTFKKKKSQCSFGPFLIYLCKVGVEAGERFQCAWNRY